MFYDKSGLSLECLSGDNMYSIECIYNQICPQFNHYFIKLGIIIILLYIIMTWSLWWFLNYRYRRTPSRFKIINKIYDKLDNMTQYSGFMRIFGDLKDIDQRIYLDSWIRHRFLKLCIGFIAVVVWLSINTKI